MAFTLSTSSKAPEFDLPGSDGKNHTFKSVQGKNGTLIFFTSNHCPFVVGSEARQKDLYEQITPKGISMVAVHSNETAAHPGDTFPLVIKHMEEMGFKWLSLHDEAQLVARAFGAQRTPHFFLFDAEGKLVYSGRMDNSPRDASKVETHELQDAIDNLLSGKAPNLAETDAIGCNVKWWDMEEHWMPGEACDLDYLYTKFPQAKMPQTA